MSHFNTFPLLLTGLLALLGFLTPLKPLLFLPVLIVAALLPTLPKRGRYACLAGFLLYPLALLMNTLMLPILEEELKGIFYVKIDQIKESRTAFGSGVQYQGRIASIETAQKKTPLLQHPLHLLHEGKK